jgi:peptidoglycan/xylan/chitin deacetylase (PgdA/CDA1 family)
MRFFSRFVAAALAVVALAIGAAGAQAATTIVSLQFDGALATQTQAVQMLAQRGLHGTFFVSSGLVGTPRYMTWGQIGQAAAAGHEIGGFSTNHTNLSPLNPAQVRVDVCADRAAIQAHGFGVSDFAYPFGLPATAPSDAIEAAVRSCGYDSARTTTVPDGFAEPIPPVDPLATRAFQWAIDPQHSLAALQGAVMNAEQHGGGWIQYAFQDICDGCDPKYSIPAATLTAFLDWLAPRAPSGTVVRTTREALGSAKIPLSSPTAAPPRPGTPGAGGSAGPGGTNRTARPAVSKVRLGHARVTTSGIVRLTYRLNAAATVRVTAARRAARRFVKLSRAVTLSGRAGLNRARFPVRLLRLTKGTYRLTLVATDAAGRKSVTQAVRLIVVR